MDNNKYYYKIYGLTLSSDYEFPQFLSIEDKCTEVDIEIEYGGITDEILAEISEGYYKTIKKDEMWFHNHVGIFWIHDKRKINFVEYNHGTKDDAAVFLPGMCLAILLWYREMIMIHGACIRIKDKTVIVAGNSGSGKSTLTTELIKHGALLIADDVTGISIINGVYVSLPAFPAQKLCVDQIERNSIDKKALRQVKYDFNKYEVPLFDSFYYEPSKVDAFFRVEVQSINELIMQEIQGAEKLKVITDSIFIKWLFNDAFRFEPGDMKRCIDFANQIKTYRICRNKDHDTLQEILDYIERNI